jgi:D-methionine transport system ATP-binding protein
MIELVNLNKTFKTKTHTVTALKNVSLKISDGEIFGIIGLSGAGKSTVVRCINLLERPDSGEVILDGEDIMKFNAKEIRARRKTIGMIFQHFNLFRSRNIFGNIAFPLLHTGLSDAEIEKRVKELADLVGISSKLNSYPSQLSGGQKQRVGIARALATNPKILLCDEATSALDPKTTQSILALLKELNKKFNLTIVIVTHEMEVIKEICDEVAVMEGGRVIESGGVFDVFAKAKQKLTKEFIGTTSTINKIYDLIREDSPILKLEPGEVLVRFSYSDYTSVEPLLFEISTKFNIKPNIIFGDIDIIQSMPIGELILKIDGSKEDQHKAFEYVKQRKVTVEVIKSL